MGKPIETKKFKELSAAVLRQLPLDIDPKVAQRWIEDQGALAATLRQALMNTPAASVEAPSPMFDHPEPTISSHPLMIDHSRTWNEWRMDIGIDFLGWNSKITRSRFPITQSEEVELAHVITLHFGRVVTTAEVRAYREKNGLKPIEFVHQLALAAARPDLQLLYPLVNIDADGVGDDRARAMLVLDSLPGNWTLHHISGAESYEWDASHRFLALRPCGKSGD